MPALSPAETTMEALRIASAQAAASAKLRSALLAGTDTAGIRRELADLDRQVSELAAEQQEAAGLQEAAQMDAIQRAAAEHANDVARRLNARLEALAAPALPTPSLAISMRTPMTDPAIEAAAHGVAEAEADLQSAGVKLNEAETEAHKVAVRISALDSQRLEIIGRRQRDDARPDDGATLEVIKADQEGLSGLLAEAEAAVDQAKGPVQAAKQALSNARAALQRAEDEQAQSMLVAHANKLSDLMLATLQELGEMQQRLGQPRPAWIPSKQHYDTMRRLAAVGGLL